VYCSLRAIAAQWLDMTIEEVKMSRTPVKGGAEGMPVFIRLFGSSRVLGESSQIFA
jgi:hypothetical protein